jgi:hypothetical protein
MSFPNRTSNFSPRKNSHSLKLKIKTYLLHRLRRPGLLLNIIITFMPINIAGLALQLKLIPCSPQVN